MRIEVQDGKYGQWFCNIFLMFTDSNWTSWGGDLIMCLTVESLLYT